MTQMVGEPSRTMTRIYADFFGFAVETDNYPSLQTAATVNVQTDNYPSLQIRENPRYPRHPRSNNPKSANNHK
jgi:hypothetical protein